MAVSRFPAPREWETGKPLTTRSFQEVSGFLRRHVPKSPLGNQNLGETSRVWSRRSAGSSLGWLSWRWPVVLAGEAGMTSGSLNPGQRRTLEIIQAMGFGRVEDLSIRSGEPYFEP